MYVYTKMSRFFKEKKTTNKERTNNHTMFLIRVCKKKNKGKILRSNNKRTNYKKLSLT